MFYGLIAVRFYIEIILVSDIIADIELLRHRRLSQDLRRCADQHETEVHAQCSENESGVVVFTVAQSLFLGRIVGWFSDCVAVRLSRLFGLFGELTLDHLLHDRFLNIKGNDQLFAV